MSVFSDQTSAICDLSASENIPNQCIITGLGGKLCRPLPETFSEGQLHRAARAFWSICRAQCGEQWEAGNRLRGFSNHLFYRNDPGCLNHGIVSPRSPGDNFYFTLNLLDRFLHAAFWNGSPQGPGEVPCILSPRGHLCKPFHLLCLTQPWRLRLDLNLIPVRLLPCPALLHLCFPRNSKRPRTNLDLFSPGNLFLLMPSPLHYI